MYRTVVARSVLAIGLWALVGSQVPLHSLHWPIITIVSPSIHAPKPLENFKKAFWYCGSKMAHGSGTQISLSNKMIMISLKYNTVCGASMEWIYGWYCKCNCFVIPYWDLDLGFSSCSFVSQDSFSSDSKMHERLLESSKSLSLAENLKIASWATRRTP